MSPKQWLFLSLLMHMKSTNFLIRKVFQNFSASGFFLFPFFVLAFNFVMKELANNHFYFLTDDILRLFIIIRLQLH